MAQRHVAQAAQAVRIPAAAGSANEAVGRAGIARTRATAIVEHQQAGAGCAFGRCAARTAGGARPGANAASAHGQQPGVAQQAGGGHAAFFDATRTAAAAGAGAAATAATDEKVLHRGVQFNGCSACQLDVVGQLADCSAQQQLGVGA